MNIYGWPILEISRSTPNRVPDFLSVQVIGTPRGQRSGSPQYFERNAFISTGNFLEFHGLLEMNLILYIILLYIMLLLLLIIIISSIIIIIIIILLLLLLLLLLYIYMYNNILLYIIWIYTDLTHQQNCGNKRVWMRYNEQRPLDLGVPHVFPSP